MIAAAAVDPSKPIFMNAVGAMTRRKETTPNGVGFPNLGANFLRGARSPGVRNSRSYCSGVYCTGELCSELSRNWISTFSMS